MHINSALKSVGACVMASILLHMMGRISFCHCGEWWRPWIGDVWSNHTSQHFLDPYSFSHFQHGMIFYWILAAVGRAFLSYAVLIESCWELLENTPFIINRYREGTVSLNYTGDSITNSMGDIVSALVGFLVTRKTRLPIALSLYFVVEVGMLYSIRDCLTLNVIMLIWPIDGIRLWQAGTALLR